MFSLPNKYPTTPHPKVSSQNSSHHTYPSVGMILLPNQTGFPDNGFFLPANSKEQLSTMMNVPVREDACIVFCGIMIQGQHQTCATCWLPRDTKVPLMFFVSYSIESSDFFNSGWLYLQAQWDGAVQPVKLSEAISSNWTRNGWS